MSKQFPLDTEPTNRLPGRHRDDSDFLPRLSASAALLSARRSCQNYRQQQA